MITATENNEQDPLCPHCEKPLREVYFRSLKAQFGRRYLYFCAGCQKVLGISHRKGFWMG